MKILHIEGGRRLYGGAYQVLHLLQGLSQRGHCNLLVCPRACDLAHAAAPFAEVKDIPMHGDADLLLVPRILGILRSARPDLVHLHSRIGADTWGALAARIAGLPVVHTRRVDNPEAPVLAAFKYRLHDRVIAISEAIGRVLIAQGLPPAKLRVVRSAVDAARWARPCERRSIADRVGIPVEGPWLAVVAQLIERKGHRFLLEALPPLVAAYPGLRVLFLGQGPMAPQLRVETARLGLGGHVHFAGFRYDLDEILPCLDLLVHPATLEGLGVALLQAASAGVPIVASRAGGIPEAVRDGENGVLVPPGDVAALGDAIGALLADPERRRALGAGGQALMARELSIEAMVEGNLAVYRELVGA